MSQFNDSTNVQWTALLDEAVNKPGTVMQAYSAFWNYSVGNQILAMVQCGQRGIPVGPIASFMAWKDKGRYVKKGEKALILCRPVTCKRKSETDENGQEQDAGTFTRFV